jgi:hypothetical protein
VRRVGALRSRGRIIGAAQMLTTGSPAFAASELSQASCVANSGATEVTHGLKGDSRRFVEPGPEYPTHRSEGTVVPANFRESHLLHRLRPAG